MKGKITQWKDEKGFGFILPESGGEKLFFHISSVKNQARRPQVGDTVLYDAVRDEQNRLKAKGVVIDGVNSNVGAHKSKSVIYTEPVKKNVVDYVLMLVAVLSLAFGFLAFYQTGSIAKAAPLGVLLLISVAVLNRQKKPKEKMFSCARCKKAENHNKRTIRAWNNGFTKLYCGSCHHKWLQENSEPETSARSSGGGRGCLGIAALLILLPIAAGFAVYEWLV